MNNLEDTLADLKDRFAGKRIQCISMKDKNPVPPETRGTCYDVDGMGQLLMNWDNGSTLSLIPGVDEFTVISYAL